MKPKSPTSIRLTKVAKYLLKALADKQGISQAAMLEILIREKAKTEGIITKNE